ncbi:hypothetical protein BJV77DRAFT_1032922 [Russula vinacea]|nr:hypothetical protein BJV77DRAFT_1032922 [Russula vinacea]
MRLSLFALFFALPAAYAAVSPLKQTIRSEDFCLPDATCTISTEDTDCCTSITGLQCYTPSGSDSGVCPIAHLLLFTLVTELNAVLLGITADIGRCRKGDSGMVQVTVMPWTLFVALYVCIVFTPILQLPLRNPDKPAQRPSET